MVIAMRACAAVLLVACAGVKPGAARTRTISQADAGTAPCAEKAQDEIRPDPFGAPTRKVAEGLELSIVVDASARLLAELKRDEPPPGQSRQCFEALASYRCLVSKNEHGYLVVFLPTRVCGDHGFDGDRIWMYNDQGEFVDRWK